jgi:hypothetical protein
LDGLDGTSSEDPGGPGLECDFCQNRVPSIRRVALDGDYERLTTPHSVQYACSDCFEVKDRARLGLASPG